MILPRGPSLLIVGCGDVGERVLRQLGPGWRPLAMTRDAARAAPLRALGAVPVLADLDRPHSLNSVAALAPQVLYLAPPPNHGVTDPRLRAFLHAAARSGVVQQIVYASTTGVWGDCAGAKLNETRMLAPATPRAQRRVDAERMLRQWAARAGRRATVLRIPGIYAPDRPGGNPLDRVRAGQPVLRPEDDVHTNHIHADDLARACIRALHAPRARGGRAYIVSDDDTRTMGRYYSDLAARAGLPAPPQLTREEAQRVLSPMQMSFLSESRRLDSSRARRELRWAPHYPRPEDALWPQLWPPS